MSDIRFSVNAVASKGPFSSINSASVTASMATAGMLSVTLDLNTAVTTISTATMNAVGVAFLRSLTTTETHTVSFGRMDGTTLHESVRLRAGEAGLIRLAPGSYGARAAVTGSRILINILED